MTATVIRGDARRLPFDDESVDLICTSPPYWNLRDYKKKDGKSLPGQIGAEATWREYIDNLVECAAEWDRVLKPGGSMFVVLGDKYSDRGHGPHRGNGTGRAPQGTRLRQSRGPQEKSLLGLPWRFAFGCADELGLTIRAEIIWDKKNPLPESVGDRVRRGHENIFHLVKSRYYYSAVDEIREPHLFPGKSRTSESARDAWAHAGSQKQTGLDGVNAEHPLGKLPGSVWVWPIASAPLKVPARIEHAHCCGGRKRPGCKDGLDHHAAYPPALARKIISGWSPPGICTKCGDGRFPATSYTGQEGRRPGGQQRHDSRTYANLSDAPLKMRTIDGYVCSCTPYTQHPGSRKRLPRTNYGDPDGLGQFANPGGGLGNKEHTGPWREYHFDLWTPAPTTPAVVLDPFGGTGTTPMVAELLGRAGFAVELSDGYCGLAQWRINDPGERARALEVPKPPPVSDGQLSFAELVS